MKRWIIIILALIIALSIGIILYTNNPPTIKTANSLYQKNKNQIDTVVNFLENAEYSSIIIDKSYKTMNADYETVEISDENTQKALKDLYDRNVNIFFFKTDGDIQLRIYIKNKIRYWIAKSTCNTVPDVQYATEIIPMDEDGWYFIIADSTKGKG